MSDKPIPESYWVVPGQFLAGEYPASTRGDEAFTRQRMTDLLNSGFDTFIDLTRADELPDYLPILREEAARYGIPIDYRRISIQDRNLPSMEQMMVLLVAIDSSLAAGRKIYLHCWGGIGRTGTAVGCWLVRHGLSGEAALTHLNELYQTSEQYTLFPFTPETDAQLEFILNWGENSLAVPHPRPSPAGSEEGGEE